MVYDEGMDVYVGGRSYFTFFRYSKREQSSQPDKVEDFKWHCGETLTGWFHPQPNGYLPGGPGGLHAMGRPPASDSKWGCFIAKQVEGPSVGVATNEDGKAGLAITTEDPVAVLSPTEEQGEPQDVERFSSQRLGEEDEGTAGAAAGLEGKEGQTGENSVGTSSLRGLAALTGGSGSSVDPVDLGVGTRAPSESIVDAMPLPDFSGGAPAAPSMVRALAARRHPNVAAAAAGAGGSVTSTAAAVTHGVDGEASLLQAGAGLGAGASLAGAPSWRSEDSIDAAKFRSSRAFVDHVNGREDLTWSARVHPHLEGMPETEVRQRLGASGWGKTGAHRRAALDSARQAGAEGRSLDQEQERNLGSRTAGRGGAVLAPAAMGGGSVQHRFRSQNARRRTYAQARALSLSSFPDSLDWRKVDGGAYATRVVDQGQCGSCYAVAATDAISMRRLIRRAVLEGKY